MVTSFTMEESEAIFKSALCYTWWLTEVFRKKSGCSLL